MVVVVTSQTKQHPNQQVVYWCNLDKKKTNINWLGRTLNVTHPLPPPLAKWWWTEWGPWSSCSKPSGGGERTRERFCDSNGVAFNIDRVMPKECAEESNKKESQKCRKGREGKSFEKWTRTELFLKCPRNWNLISKFNGGVRFDRGEGSILANGPTVGTECPRRPKNSLMDRIAKIVASWHPGWEEVETETNRRKQCIDKG